MARRKKVPRYFFKITAAIFLCTFFLFRSQPAYTPIPSSFRVFPEKTFTAYVDKVIDGDTVRLSNGEKVRLIGIDTMETRQTHRLEKQIHEYNKERSQILERGDAAKTVAKTLLEGKKVFVETDTEKRDRYDRLLGYLFLEDQTFVNAEMVRKGYADAFQYGGNRKYAAYFSELAEEAKREHRGIWN